MSSKEATFIEDMTLTTSTREGDLEFGVAWRKRETLVLVGVGPFSLPGGAKLDRSNVPVSHSCFGLRVVDAEAVQCS